MNKNAAGEEPKLKAPLIESALYYQRIGFSVIPIKSNKKPYVSWTKFQTEPAGPAQIRQWWGKWPNANIGLVTGSVSGVDVVDVDTDAGWDVLNEFLPETLQTPTARTPGGGYHVYFDYKKGLSNGVRVIEGCDLRTSGGYVVAPPSQNGNGKTYSWLEGLKITDVKPAVMPEMLFDILLQGGPPDGHASSREHIKKDDSLYKKKFSIRRRNISETFSSKKSETSETIRNERNISFEKGFRDDTIFHIATCLHRGGMEPANISKTLHFLGTNCSPSFPVKEIEAKIQSVLKRSDAKEIGLTAQIREFIDGTWGVFSETLAQQNVTIRNNRNIRPKIRSILSRIARTEKTIERVPGKSGFYRKIENDCDAENCQHACTDTVDLWLPFELGEIVEVMPGDIVLIAGSQNSGKSALMMNIAKENRDSYKIHYFSSELRPGSFRRRMAKFPDVSTDQLNIKFYQRSSNFADVIKTGEGNLNLIDYVEMHDQFYKISEIFSELHDKLCGALLVAAIQKDPKSLYGRGGSFNQEKPVLSISLDHGVATISKCKEWREDQENPNKMQYLFKIIDGCRLQCELGWHKPVEPIE